MTTWLAHCLDNTGNTKYRTIEVSTEALDQIAELAQDVGEDQVTLSSCCGGEAQRLGTALLAKLEHTWVIEVNAARRYGGEYVRLRVLPSVEQTGAAEAAAAEYPGVDLDVRPVGTDAARKAWLVNLARFLQECGGFSTQQGTLSAERNWTSPQWRVP